MPLAACHVQAAKTNFLLRTIKYLSIYLSLFCTSQFLSRPLGLNCSAGSTAVNEFPSRSSSAVFLEGALPPPCVGSPPVVTSPLSLVSSALWTTSTFAFCLQTSYTGYTCSTKLIFAQAPKMPLSVSLSTLTLTQTLCVKHTHTHTSLLINHSDYMNL